MDRASQTGVVAESVEAVLADGRYVVWRKIASGSQADTLEAVDRQTGRAVAIKRFSVGHAKAWKDVELAEREARVLSSLSHPALPSYLDHFEEEGSLYLVMELVQGENLASIIRDGKRLGMNQLLSLMKSLSDILEYLHSRVPPVIHRDIKPANVILRPDGTFCLVDFGSVRDGLRPEGGSTVVGTFGYMAPEQFQGRAMPATDVYAVGALILALLTGKGPEQLAHQGLTIDVQASVGGAVSANWVRVLSQMVAIDPDRRPSALKPLLAELEGKASEARAHTSSEEPDFASQRGEAEPDGSFTVMVGTGFGILPWLFLTVARFVVWFALGVVVPIILSLLAIFFGPRFRAAAYRVSAAGQSAQARIALIADHLRRAEPFVLEGKHYRRRRPGRSDGRGPGGFQRGDGRRWRGGARIDSPRFHFDTGPAHAADTAERQQADDDTFRPRDGNTKKKDESA